MCVQEQVHVCVRVRVRRWQSPLGSSRRGSASVRAHAVKGVCESGSESVRVCVCVCVCMCVCVCVCACACAATAIAIGVEVKLQGVHESESACSETALQGQMCM